MRKTVDPQIGPVKKKTPNCYNTIYMKRDRNEDSLTPQCPTLKVTCFCAFSQYLRVATF